MTRVDGPASGRIPAVVPTRVIVSPQTATASANGRRASTVWTFALMMITSGVQGTGPGV